MRFYFSYMFTKLINSWNFPIDIVIIMTNVNTIPDHFINFNNCSITILPNNLNGFCKLYYVSNIRIES
ncbi:hypothetical protein SAMN03080601_01058 [Alkalitalea saponilacus]|uniref:Uncharacterized protein n=1 Tax=Alkalitalea saponilacus TaxID=889453 RepID=A0A1T5DC46_9BACT|nr:hypothetical protein SAMN03080601_01058 [Alkalitalea saponilacus]